MWQTPLLFACIMPADSLRRTACAVPCIDRCTIAVTECIAVFCPADCTGCLIRAGRLCRTCRMATQCPRCRQGNVIDDRCSKVKRCAADRPSAKKGACLCGCRRRCRLVCDSAGTAHRAVENTTGNLSVVFYIAMKNTILNLTAANDRTVENAADNFAVIQDKFSVISNLFQFPQAACRTAIGYGYHAVTCKFGAGSRALDALSVQAEVHAIRQGYRADMREA